MRQVNKQGRKRRKHCLYCGELFEPDPRTKGKQKYCSKPACQIKRQRLNEAAWRRRNPECLAEQYELTRIWHRNHSNYSRQRRRNNPLLLQQNLIQTSLRMRRIRKKQLFDKSKVILTQLVGNKRDKYYLTQGYKWLLVRLTKASLLSRAGIIWDNHSCLRRVTKHLPLKAGLYELSGIF